MRNTILIVDDSDIDRGILKNILENDFDIVEADNGYNALKILLSGRPHIHGILMDIFMPVLDSFEVLRIMKENKIENIPVVLVTANPTKTNVEKAASYKVTHFITKPFDANTVLERMCTLFSITAGDSEEEKEHEESLPDSYITETNKYISKLKEIYNVYLKNNDMDDEHFVRTSAIAEILLDAFAATDKSRGLSSEHISIIAKAAYFFDIGRMAVPDEILAKKNKTPTERSIFKSHTVAGAEIVWLNHSPSCQYFVKICGDMCMHHHERFDGRGYPHGLVGNDNSIYTQICALSRRFDRLFSKRPEINDRQFNFVINELSIDRDEFNPMLISLLSDCRFSIASYYKKYKAASYYRKNGGT